MVSLCKGRNEDVRHENYFKILVRRAGLWISGIILNLIFTSLFGQERNKGKDGRERRRKEKSEKY